MPKEMSDLQFDLQAWIDDEKGEMTVTKWAGILDVPNAIAELPKFVKLMTVNDLLEVIDNYC